MEPINKEFMEKHYDKLDEMQLVKDAKAEAIRENIEPIQTAISEIGKKLEQIREIVGLKSPFCEKITNTATKTVESEICPKVISPAKKRKILIGTPICSEKMYSWDKYVKAVKGLIPVKGAIGQVYIVSTVEDKKIAKAAGDEGFSYAWIKGNGKPMDKLVQARNTIFNYALNNDYDYVLFIDSDVIVPKGTMERLVSHGVGIAGGFYPITTEEGLPTPNAKYRVLGATPPNDYMDFPPDQLNDKINLVDLIGMGCTLISREIFLNYSFRCERGEYGDLKRSEDMCFCEDLRKDNIPINFDTALVSKHIVSGNHWDPEEA